MTLTNLNLISFKAINSFVTAINDVFEEKNKGVQLYAHLLKKTTLDHEVAITKHHELFKNFCIENRDAIETKTVSSLVNTEIVYSDKVKFDIIDVFKLEDPDVINIAWKHILTISATVDTAGQAKRVLKDNVSTADNGNEVDFLGNIIGKIEESIDPDTPPLEAISSIMKSGVFTDLITGMGNGLQDGSIDLGKLMGGVQKMMGDINSDSSGGGIDMASMMSMMGAPKPPPDISDKLD